MKTLDLYITKVCNLDCDYCYVDIVKNEKTLFPTEAFLERINLLEYDDIKFFGGEPLTKWKIIQDIVDAISKQKKSVNFTIVTNGVLINKSKISYILEKNINIVVSIHEGSFIHLKNNMNILQDLKNNIGFYIIFDPKSFDITLRNFLFFFSKGFTNFCFAPEIYGNWNDTNLLKLEKILDKITPYVIKYDLKIAGISHNSLKIYNRGCEKSVYDELGNFVPCNRFKSLKEKSKFNYKQVYDTFESQIGLDSDPLRWFYICPVGWYLDNENNNLNQSIKRFKKLNHVFINFYRKIHTHHLTFFSQDIEEIRFNVTQQCNLRCEYCYVDFKNNILDVTTGKNIIDFFFEQSGNEKSLAFFGGEPLLEFNILQELVEYSENKSQAFQKKVSYSIATNFTIMNQEIYNFLVKHNFDIHISFNGDIKDNNILRDKSSDLVLANIKKYISSNDRKKICILFAFGPTNVNDIFKNLSFLAQQGIESINLELIFGEKYPWKKPDIDISMKQIITFSHEYPHVEFKNLKTKKRFLDINTNGVANENSLEFFGSSIDKGIKNSFDTLLKKYLKF